MDVRVSIHDYFVTLTRTVRGKLSLGKRVSNLIQMTFVVNLGVEPFSTDKLACHEIIVVLLNHFAGLELFGASQHMRLVGFRSRLEDQLVPPIGSRTTLGRIGQSKDCSAVKNMSYMFCSAPVPERQQDFYHFVKMV